VASGYPDKTLKRLFVGVALNEEALASLVGVQEKLREVATHQGVRFVRPDKLHLTLQFLDAQPSDAAEEIDRVAAPLCALVAPFEVTMKGLGAFPSFLRPKVLWVGIEEQTDSLLRLQETIATALVEFAKPGEATYTPHITLARVVPGSPQVGRAALPLSNELADQEIAMWRVEEVLLYESTPDGRYEVLRTWPLLGG